MGKLSMKKLIVAAALSGAVGLSVVPMSASASQNHHYSYAQHGMRWVSRHEAREIAQKIFPNRHIESIHLRWDDGVREYQVLFMDGTRIDVRQSNGRVTYVDSSRSVNRAQARRIAEGVFPRKDVSTVNLRMDGGTSEYRVRFTDGSRVDVREHDGRTTFVHSNN
jgi:uncharacterized membrane protein YkoI